MLKTSKALTDEQYESMGRSIVEILNLKRVQGSKSDEPSTFLYYTEWGTKTHKGIAKMMHRLTKEFEGMR